MAKKLTKSTQVIESEKIQKKSEETMVSKVEVKQPLDQDRISRIVGTIFIVLGVLLVSFGIYSFVKYNGNPQVDETFASPTLVGTQELTKEGKIVVKGSANSYDTVIVYLDGEEKSRAKVSKDGSFSSEISVENQGKYNVTVSGIKGFPMRYASPVSESLLVTVDWTAPTLSEIKYSKEVGTETFAVTGKIEKDAQIIIKRGTDFYSATCDQDGNFKLSGIVLDEGANVFNVVIKDKAGNETEVADKIRVTYSPDSDVNGNAVNDENKKLPKAAGELSSALDALLGNKMMIIFGLLALLAGSASTVITYKKTKRN